MPKKNDKPNDGNNQIQSSLLDAVKNPGKLKNASKRVLKPKLKSEEKINPYIQQLINDRRSKIEPEEPQDYDSDDDFGSKVSFAQEKTPNRKSKIKAKTQTQVDDQSSAPPSLYENLQGIIPQFSKKAYTEEDLAADAEFGIEISKKAYTEEDLAADAEFGIENSYSAPSNVASVKPHAHKLASNPAFTAALDALTKCTTKVAKSTEETIASAMEISHEVDKGPKRENPVKLVHLAEQTQQNIKTTVVDVAALNKILQNKAQILAQQLPKETESAKHIAEIAKTSLEFAKSEVKLAMAAAARDSAIKAAKQAIAFAKARSAQHVRKEVTVGKIKDNPELKKSAEFVAGFVDKVANEAKLKVMKAEQEVKDAVYAAKLAKARAMITSRHFKN